MNKNKEKIIKKTNLEGQNYYYKSDEDKSFLEISNTFFKHLFKLSNNIQLIILTIPKQKNSHTFLIYKERGKKIVSNPKKTILNISKINEILEKEFKIKKSFFSVLNSHFFNKINSFKKPTQNIKKNSFKSILIIEFITNQKYKFFLQLIFDSKKTISKVTVNKIEKFAKLYVNIVDYYLTIKGLLEINKIFEKSLSHILELLISLLEVKDPYTFGHSNNVKEISMLIAEELNLDTETKKNIELAAILHDIGKIGISDIILQKPSILNDFEFEEVKKHSLKGALLLAHIPSFKNIAKIIMQHHERYDGKGYPISLSGENILIESRIIAVADTFDAITSQRPYRTRKDEKTAIEIIKSESGRQFDPKVVEALLKVIEKKKHLKNYYQLNDNLFNQYDISQEKLKALNK